MIISDLYKTKIQCLKESNNENYYNVNLNATDVIVRVTLIDFNGESVMNKEVTITVDNGIFTEVKSSGSANPTLASSGKSATAITNIDGVIELRYTASQYGLATFSTSTDAQQSILVASNPYPIGSIYISINNTHPSTLFGGTWQKIEGQFLLSASSTKTEWALGKTGGEASHTLNINEMPKHTHTQSAHTHTMGSNGASVPRISGKDNWGYTSKRNMQYSSGNNYYPYSTANHDGIGEIDHVVSATAKNQDTGGGQAHNNMPPFVAVNMWQRTG